MTAQRVYVETSALLRALVEGDRELAVVIDAVQPVTSVLTFVEAARALRRVAGERRVDANRLRDAQRAVAAAERAWEIVRLDEDVLARAREAFPVEPVRTLDAIHLASAQAIDPDYGGVAFATCDDRVRRNAEALGFEVVPRR